MQIQCFFQEVYFAIFFSKGKQPQNLLCQFFSEKLKFPRANTHLISLARRASC